MRSRAAVFLAALLLVFLASCVRSKQASSPASAGPATGSPALSGTVPAPAATPQPAPPPMPAAPGRTITLTQEHSPPVPARAKKDTGISSLLSLGWGQGVLPEDFKIGGLQDPRTGGAEDQQAMKTIDTFLSRLSAGRVDPSLLAPGAKERITDVVSFGIEHGNVPRSWRVGDLRKRENGELSAPVRLFGDPGTSEGEITLAQTARQWLVTDFQISLGALQEKPEKPKERFFPSSYRWMLEQ